MKKTARKVIKTLNSTEFEPTNVKFAPVKNNTETGSKWVDTTYESDIGNDGRFLVVARGCVIKTFAKQKPNPKAVKPAGDKPKKDKYSTFMNLKDENFIAMVEKYEEYINEKSYFDFVSVMLKDGGIKTRIIKQYLPILNKYINQYLSQMDFFVNFNINENFEEVIKSRHRDEFTYASFSEGQKMRLDLAILFSFRQLAKIKNSVNTNLLILDEIMDSSLDTDGTDVLMNFQYSNLKI